MAITYPLSLPTSIGMANIEFTATNVVAVSQSPFTLEQQILQYPGQSWSVNVTLPAQQRDLMEPWIAFLLSLQGPVGTFVLGDPNGKTPLGVGGGTPLVNGGSQTGNSLNIDGCPISTTNWLKAGDYVQVRTGSSRTLHKVLTNVTTNASGQATLDIWPKLRSAPADNASVVITNAAGIFRLSTPQTTWSIDNATKYGISFTATEAI